ncbi:trypsin-like peptidase domain-containing protein [Luteolibacter sp. Y139]|uniref:Trypsin-like peptidase domain-containing protein n=2 Tax=Luteolibacter soli TaxID=3135280 RepID=A0ABU9AWG1_9BACT
MNAMKIARWLIIPLFASGATAQVKDATKLFEALEPSVVLISDEEGGGSGVVLSADGMILTNAHVAGAALPLTVSAIVEEGGKTVLKSFPNAELHKVHATSDLALLKLTAPGCRFRPASLSKSEDDTKTGGTCYALGFPFLPGQNKPAITITKGIISSARRMVGELPYIQLDAALNPGNSGGALVNDKGILIGIPTLRIEGTERIGMATPIAGLKMDQFVDPKDRKGDPQEARRLSNIASALTLRDALSLGFDDEAAALALYLQRQAIALEPNNPEWSIAISSMYLRFDKTNLARAYAEQAVKLAPKSLNGRLGLAELFDALKEPEKAAAQRMAGLPLLTDSTEPELRKNLFEKLAENFLATGQPVRALYMLSWSGLTTPADAGPAQRLALQTAERSVPQALLREIMDKKTGHSLEDMEAIVRRAATAGPVTPLPVEPRDDTGKKTGASTVVTEVHFKNGVEVRMADSPPGVTFNREKGTVEWTPPPFSRVAEARVLFALKNPDGNEELEVVVLRRN